MIADVDYTIKAMRTLYFNPELREEMGAKGRAYAEQYTPEILMERWHETFQEVMEPKRVSMDSIFLETV